MELIEDDYSLKQAQFYNMICLYLQEGIPSKYGQKRLRFCLAEYQLQSDYNGHDNVFFKFRDLFELPVSTLAKTLDTKLIIAAKINHLYPQLNVDAQCITLREKSAEKLLQVYHDESILEKYSMYDGKEVAVQIDSESHIKYEHDEEDRNLLMFKEWDPSTWQLSDPKEIYIPKNATLDQLGRVLNTHFPHIAFEDVSCTKINSAWNFHRVQLPFEAWHTLKDNQNFVASGPFYVSTDGLLFIIKDNSKVERYLTEEEKYFYNCGEYENQIFTSSTNKQNGKNCNKEKGITITVKKATTMTGDE